MISEWTLHLLEPVVVHNIEVLFHDIHVAVHGKPYAKGSPLPTEVIN